MYEHVKLVAPTEMAVLITGSSGTGKEYVARRIHEQSNRVNAPFIAIDCGAIPKELAASEFFGHIKGSFTGAIENKTGAFVMAQGGTIFLDEIGNLTYEVQVQLLRALQERKVRPVGSNQEIAINVRLVSATNENLRQAIEKENSGKTCIIASTSSPFISRTFGNGMKTCPYSPTISWTWRTTS